MSKKSVPYLVLAIIFSLIFCGWMVVRIVAAIQFNINCEEYIKRAADANTIEMAKEELAKAIDYTEQNNLTEGIVSIFLKNPKNDVGFWYDNMVAAYEELDNLPEDSEPLEKTNVLMKLRESLTDSSSGNTEVTCPDGISIYPNNVLYFWWSIGSFILMVACWITFLVKLDEYWI